MIRREVRPACRQRQRWVCAAGIAIASLAGCSSLSRPDFLSGIGSQKEPDVGDDGNRDTRIADGKSRLRPLFGKREEESSGTDDAIAAAESKPSGDADRQPVRHDPQTRMLIETELRDASPEERAEWIAYLNTVDSRQVPHLLSSRRTKGSDPSPSTDVQASLPPGDQTLLSGSNQPRAATGLSATLASNNTGDSSEPPPLPGAAPWGRNSALAARDPETPVADPRSAVGDSTDEVSDDMSSDAHPVRTGMAADEAGANIQFTGATVVTDPSDEHPPAGFGEVETEAPPADAATVTADNAEPLTSPESSLPIDQWPEDSFPDESLPGEALSSPETVRTIPSAVAPSTPEPASPESSFWGIGGLFAERTKDAEPVAAPAPRAATGAPPAEDPARTDRFHVRNLIPRREKEETAVEPFPSTGPASVAGESAYWQDELKKLISMLEVEASRWEPGATDAERHEYVRRQAQLRMLYLVDGRTEHALQAIPEADVVDQEYWTHSLWSLSTALDREGIPDPAERAAQAMVELAAAQRSLQQRAPLDLRNVSFCHKIDGFGDYQRWEQDEFQPGQPVLLYAEVRNFHSEPTVDGFFRTVLKSTIEIVRAGETREFVDSSTFAPTADLCRSRRTDYYHSYKINLPQTLRTGPHILKLTIEDQLSGRTSTHSVNFNIQ